MLKRNIGEPNSFTNTTLKSKVDYTAIAFFSIFNNTKKVSSRTTGLATFVDLRICFN